MHTKPGTGRRKRLIAVDPERLGENRSAQELRCVERSRVRESKRREEVKTRREGDIGVRQSTRKKVQAVVPEVLDHANGFGESTDARDFHRDAVEEFKLMKALEVRQGYDSLVHQNRQGTESAQRAVAGQSIGG